MGDCHYDIETIFIDVRDPQITRVIVTIGNLRGDCPFIPLKYEKAFPARIPVIDPWAIDGGIKDVLLW